MIIVTDIEAYSDNGSLIRRRGAADAYARTTIRLGETADDFEEVTAEQIKSEATEREHRLAYEAEVERLIRLRYTASQELALLRQRDSKPDEFATYNAYAEQCKAEAKSNL